jgi:hypothetical protein
LKIKRSDLVNFYRTTKDIAQQKLDAKFQYALNKNLKKIFNTQKEIDAQAMVPGYDNYINEFQAFEASIAEKKEDGSPIVTSVNQVSGLPIFQYPSFSKEEVEEHEKKRKEIADKHEDVIKEHQEKVKKHMETNQEEIEFEFHKVPMNLIPNVTGKEIEALELMIRDLD